MFEIFLGLLGLIALIIWGAYSRQKASRKAKKVAEQVIGMTKSRAIKHAIDNGLRYRIAGKDNQMYILSSGFASDRLNLWCRDGNVQRVKIY